LEKSKQIHGAIHSIYGSVTNKKINFYSDVIYSDGGDYGDLYHHERTRSFASITEIRTRFPQKSFRAF